jgi:hypothetical protein
MVMMLTASPGPLPQAGPETRTVRHTASAGAKGERPMYTILIIILVLLLIGALPTWGYSSGWGYYPSGGLGLLLVILVILLLMGRL